MFLKEIFFEGASNLQRQKLPNTYMPNGAIYIFKLRDFLKKNKMPTKGSHPYIMDEKTSLDIDSNHDLKKARKLII